MLSNKSGEPIDPSHIDQLQQGFRGTVVLPGDAGYDQARSIWNASIDKRPGLVARCSGVADVIAVVNFARAHDLLLSVRGGGHNVGGRALCDDGVVLDLSTMRGIFVDPSARTVRAQAGARLGDLDRETHVHGLAVPTGIISDTGIAGLTLGGGMGWLIRKYGLTCDNVIAFEVVTAEGRLVTASADEHADLYWALRGGGGNFGVVTSFLYRAHPVHTVLGGMVVYARDDAREVLHFYRRFAEGAPDELTTFAALLHTPDGAPAVALICCYCGDVQEGERVLAPLRQFGSPLMDGITTMPFPALQSMLDGAFPKNHQNYWKSAMMAELSDDAIDVSIEHAGRCTSKQSAVLIEYYGGAAARVPVADTAFPHRSLVYDIAVLGVWPDAEDSPAQIAWARDFAAALEPHAAAYFHSFIGQEDRSVERSTFGDHYERLVEVKTKYDPTNLFRVNVNVEPRSA